MSTCRFIAAAVLAAALSASAAPAWAAPLTNGANGMQPNGLASKNPTGGGNAKKPSRAMMSGRTKSRMR